MALGQAARTLQSGSGLVKGKLSKTSALRAAMSLAQGNAMAEAMLRAPTFAINASGDQRNMNALLSMYGSKGHMSAANVNPTGQLMRNAYATQEMIDAKKAKREKGVRGRLKSGKGRPVEGPNSPGWQGMGNLDGDFDDPFNDGGAGDADGGMDGGDLGTHEGDPSGGALI